jgi:hypothetical protein
MEVGEAFLIDPGDWRFAGFKGDFQIFPGKYKISGFSH